MVLYDEATVLDYEGKSIWVKHVGGPMYCVNGRWVIFDDSQDLADSRVLSRALDEFHNPFHGLERLSDSDCVVEFEGVGDGCFSIHTFNISGCVIPFDIGNKDAVKSEYDLWYDDATDVYAGLDFGDDLGRWLDAIEKKECVYE